MTKAEKIFHDIASQIPETKEGKMFGALCLKAPNGKAGVMFWKEHMIFKLPPEDEKEALSLDGAHFFDPMGGGRIMNGWVQLSTAHADKWEALAFKAMDFVKKIIPQ